METYFKLKLALEYIVPLFILAAVIIIQILLHVFIKISEAKHKRNREMSEKFWKENGGEE